MSQSFKQLLVLFTLLITIVCFQSCKTEGCTDINAINYDSDADENDGSCIFEGCTDVNAENYDSNATQDDGSCTFSRTKFLGLYGGGETCDGEDATGLEINIVESAAGPNIIDIINETAGVTVSGTVAGNNLTINDTFTCGSDVIGIAGNGTFSVVDNQDRVDIEYTFSIGGQVFSNCIGIWLKVG